jgi:hypothetical protein
MMFLKSLEGIRPTLATNHFKGLKAVRHRELVEFGQKLLPAASKVVVCGFAD